MTGIALVATFNAGGWETETSTRSLVRAYEARRSEGEALIFFRKRPLSGSFYTDGQAAEAMTAEELQARLAQGPAWVAFKERHRGRVPAELMESMQPVARGEYDLYYAGPRSRQALAR